MKNLLYFPKNSKVCLKNLLYSRVGADQASS